MILVDNVNIENVGGLRGVASEVTLLGLVEAVKAMNPTSTQQKAATQAMDLYTKSIKNAEKNTNKFSDSLKRGAERVGDFGEELVIGGDRLTEFADKLFGSTSILTRFTGYVDGLIDNFRGLSSVGANFSNSMFEMVKVSADAAMTLDDFVGFIRGNSDVLARFGGSAAQGARDFANLSREIRLGIGRSFFGMGMTIQDINEGLLGYLELETMRGRQNSRTDREVREGAAEYITQLDLLTRLTGRQRSELAATQVELQTDARIRNQINRLQAQGLDAQAAQLDAIYAFQATALPGFHDALVDLSDGVAQSPLAQALTNVVPGLREFQMAAARGEITLDEYQQGITNRFGPALLRYANSIDGARLESMRSQSGVVGALAQLVDNAYQFNQALALNTEEARAEQRNRNRLSQTLGFFEQAIIAVRKRFFDAFINSAFFRELTNFGTMLLEMFDDTTEGLRGGAYQFQGFFNTLFGEQGYLTSAIKWLASYIRTGELANALSSMADYFGSFVEGIKNFFNDVQEDGFAVALQNRISRLMDYLFGERESQPGGENRGQRQGGAIGAMSSTIANAIAQMFDAENPNNPLGNIWNYFETKYNEWVEKLFTEGENPGLFTRIWNYVEEKWNSLVEKIFGQQENNTGSLWNIFTNKWNEFVDNLFSNDTESLWSKFTSALDTYIFGNEETGEESLWQKFKNMVGIPENFGIQSLWDRFTSLVFGNNEGNQTGIIDRIVDMIDSSLSRLFTGNAFRFMIMDLGYTVEAAISSALGQAGRLIAGDSEANARAVRERQQRANELFGRLQEVDEHSTEYADIRAELGMLGYSFAQGTNGFKNFGAQGSLAVLHNTEAVVPRNTPAGEVLDAFYKSQNQSTGPSNAPSPRTFASQDQLGNKLDQLNTNIQTLVSLAASSVREEKRIRRGIGGLGSDLLTG